MGELAKWRRQNWVRIGTDGTIKGPCGTSKDKRNPDRCLPEKRARRRFCFSNCVKTYSLLPVLAIFSHPSYRFQIIHCFSQKCGTL